MILESSQKRSQTKRKLILLHHIFPRRANNTTDRAFYPNLEDSVLCLTGIMQNGLTTKEF